jgi:hypothetical protein
MTNKLLMHFGCSTTTGRFMQVSYSLLLVELGLSFQPLQVEYDRYNHLVTHTWMKMLWEKVSKFGLTVTAPPPSGGFPREGDEFIMQVILRAGYNSNEVRRPSHAAVPASAEDFVGIYCCLYFWMYFILFEWGSNGVESLVFLELDFLFSVWEGFLSSIVGQRSVVYNSNGDWSRAEGRSRTMGVLFFPCVMSLAWFAISGGRQRQRLLPEVNTRLGGCILG